jgi:hypothetical protein
MGLGTALGLFGGALCKGIGAAKSTNAQAAQMYAEAGRTIAQGAATAQDYSNEAALHNRQAKLLRVSGAYDAARAVEKGDQLIGSQEAGFASNGFPAQGLDRGHRPHDRGKRRARYRHHALLVKQGVQNEQIMQKVYSVGR